MNPFGYQLPDSIQNQLAQRYADIFNIFVRNSNFISRVSFWGVHDGNSWLNNWPVDNRENHPLLFDRNLLPKKAFHAVIETAKGSKENP
ncbi:MAG: endo-1,4-beta-xylanase [Bacteroidota bacterium]